MSAYSPPTRRIPSCSSDCPQCEAKAHTLFPLPSHQIKTQNLSFLKRHRQIFSFRVLKRQILLPFAQKQMKTLSVFAVALHPEGVDRNLNQCCGFPGLHVVALHPEGVDRNPQVTPGQNSFLASPSTRRAWIEIRFPDAQVALIVPVALHPEGVDRNVNGQDYTMPNGNVALHPEGVDRNTRDTPHFYVDVCRPPPGGRG